MIEKSWLNSKTVWFNLITTVLALLSLVEVQEFLDVKWIALINGFGNIILRVWFTNTAISK